MKKSGMKKFSVIIKTKMRCQTNIIPFTIINWVREANTVVGAMMAVIGHGVV